MHARSGFTFCRLAVAGLALSAAALPAQAQGSPSLRSPGAAMSAVVASSPAPAALDAPAARTAPAAPAAEARAVGPTMDAASVAVRQPVTAESRDADAMQARRANMGRPIALMVVGGAALLAGLIIGGGAGTAIAVGGAVIGLYGLYEYVQ